MTIVYIVFIAVSIFILYNFTSYLTTDGSLYGRRMDKKVRKIANACSYTKERQFTFNSQHEKFTIRVENAKVAEGIKYTTIPVYTCQDVYINDELVCKVHKLEGLFRKYFSTEFSGKRHDYEIAELIHSAFKAAKKS
jgi:hypothetical protein